MDHLETVKDKTKQRRVIVNTNGMNRSDGATAVTSPFKRDVAGAWPNERRRGVIVTLFGPIQSGGSRQEVTENTANNTAETQTWLPITAHSASGR